MIKSSKPKYFYGYIIVLATFIIMTMIVGGFNSFGVFFGPLVTEFDWSRGITSGSFSLTLALSGFLGIVVGKINDRFGPRLVLTVGGLLLCLGYLMLSQINSIWQLYLYYGFILGTGLSAYVVPLLSTTARWFVKRRGKMTGLVLAGVGTGTIIIPLMATWLVNNYGWRTSFLAIAILSLVFTIIPAQFLRRDPQRSKLLPDGDTSTTNGLNIKDEPGLSFRKAAHTKQIWMLSAIYFCLGFSIFAIIVHIVIHAIGQGLSSSDAATVLAISGALNVGSRAVMGNVSDKIGNRPVLIIGIVTLMVALAWLQFAKESWTLYLFGAVFGLAYGSTIVTESPIVAEFFGLRAHGVLFGIVDVGFTTGGTVGPVLIGYLFDITSSYQLGFLIMAAMSLIGLIFTLLLRPIKKEVT